MPCLAYSHGIEQLCRLAMTMRMRSIKFNFRKYTKLSSISHNKTHCVDIAIYIDVHTAHRIGRTKINLKLFMKERSCICEFTAMKTIKWVLPQPHFYIVRTRTCWKLRNSNQLKFLTLTCHWGVNTYFIESKMETNQFSFGWSTKTNDEWEGSVQGM